MERKRDREICWTKEDNQHIDRSTWLWTLQSNFPPLPHSPPKPRGLNLDWRKDIEKDRRGGYETCRCPNSSLSKEQTSLSLTQWFSTGVTLPPRRQFWSPMLFWGWCLYWVLYWVEARDTAKHPTVRPHHKELPGPNCQQCQGWETPL